MRRKLKRLIWNWILTTIQLSFAIGLLKALQERFEVESLAPLVWGLYSILFIATCLFGWRFYTGCYRDGDLLD
jgi:hypothetical protein